MFHTEHHANTNFDRPCLYVYIVVASQSFSFFYDDVRKKINLVSTIDINRASAQ